MVIPDDFGDRAGEHLRMARGKYSAWPHVVLGFLIVSMTIAAIFFLAGALVLEPPGRDPYFADRQQGDTAAVFTLIASAALGLGFSWLIFRDRWKCVEAFASRYCSGITNLSLAYVPVIAAGYALVRGARKLSGREQAHPEPPLSAGEVAVDPSDLLSLIASVQQVKAHLQPTAGNPDPLGLDRRRIHLGVKAAALVVVLVVALAPLLVKHYWAALSDAPARSAAICPDSSSYCRLPLPLEVASGLGESGLVAWLEPGHVDVMPDKLQVVVAGTITHQDASELETLRLGLQPYDAAGAEMAIVPIKAREDFMPPLRSGDSAPWYARTPVTAVPQRAVLVVLERHSVPAPAMPDEGTELALELPASAPSHFKLTALSRSHETRQLGIKTSGKRVVAVRNDGPGVVRELSVQLVPRGGVGRDLGPIYPASVVYRHMPPMYPGERRVVALSYYVMGQVAEERLVVTDIE